MNEKRSSIIRFASIIALIGNLILAILKVWAGLYSGSLAVVGDGIDSSMDVLIAIMALVVSMVVSKPADKNHPWGHGRAETVATSLLSMILFFAGGQLIFNSVQNLLAGMKSEIPTIAALIATIISIAGKIILSWSQYFFGKKAGSAMLKANAKNMLADILTSVGVLIGLIFTKLFNIGAIDLIVAILVGLWVIKNAISIFLETNLELMDGNKNNEYYKILFKAVNSVPGAVNPHRVRMRRIAGFWDIDIDIEVDPNLTVAQAHEIANKVENAIKDKIDQIFDIVVHVEPKGNRQIEGYGLMEKTL
ncbi:MAG: cation diffusion facilitator family transporter [Bacteroidales bacterium]|nr:cation diffusion facilitator family transporter [Bacteroidales bacterium]